MSRLASLLLAGTACLVGAVTLIAGWQSSSRADPLSPMIEGTVTRAPVGEVAAPARASQSPDSTSFLVTIRRPAGPPRIDLVGTDPQGRTGSVACTTCHSVRQPNLQNVSAATLDEFHQGMAFNHGKITCYACHNPDDADSLRLADGSPVAYQDVMALCSQCHGPQATAFAHGAHGGMNGFWDLSRGPQTKNNCIDCHDPHAPSYPKMVVGFKPRDRFNEPATHDHEGAASHGDH